MTTDDQSSGSFGMNIEIDLTNDPVDVGVGYGSPPWDDENTFVLRVGDCRLRLSEEQADALHRVFLQYPKTAGEREPTEDRAV